MDWNLIKEKYPKVFAKCKVWIESTKGTFLQTDPRDLYDFFDENGIYIYACGAMSEGHIKKFWYAMDFLEEPSEYGEYVDTRTEAEEQAFMKALEILEEKLRILNQIIKKRNKTI